MASRCMLLCDVVKQLWLAGAPHCMAQCLHTQPFIDPQGSVAWLLSIFLSLQQHKQGMALQPRDKGC